MADLILVPLNEFKRVQTMNCSAVDRSSLFATLSRINTLYMIARAGSGHVGSSFSSLDIVSWLYMNELRGDDIYYSSKGHDAPGLYAVLIGLGKLDFDLIHSLRRIDGLPGHPDVGTPCIESNTGSLGMGISKAKGMIFARRRAGKETHVYVMTGDGELQEGQFWESLASAVNQNINEITVMVDHNKIQSDTWVTEVNDLGDLEQKISSFGWHVVRCNGNDAAELEKTFAALKSVTDKPKLIIADTIKGSGVSFMDFSSRQSCEDPGDAPGDALYQYHSGAPDAETCQRAVDELVCSANTQLSTLGELPLRLESGSRNQPRPVADQQRLIAAYSDALVAAAEANPDLVVLDADLVKDCGLLAFREKFPERFVECGIAEQDMVSQAGGMALQGLLPVVHSFACFLSTRPNEQIYNNATEATRVIYVGSLAGLLPAGPGHSHQSVRDISALSAVPGLSMVEPSCESEVAQLLEHCMNDSRDSYYLRLVSIPCEIPYQLPADYHVETGRGVAIIDGKDAVMLAYGPVMLPQAVKAAGFLQHEYGLGLKVINLPWLNKVDPEWLLGVIDDYDFVFTLDNHYIRGGQGEMIASTIAALGLAQCPLIRHFGLTTVPLCGENDEVLKAHHLDAASLAGSVAQNMEHEG